MQSGKVAELCSCVLWSNTGVPGIQLLHAEAPTENVTSSSMAPGMMEKGPQVAIQKVDRQNARALMRLMHMTLDEPTRFFHLKCEIHLDSGVLIITLCSVEAHAPNHLQPVLHQHLDQRKFVKVQQVNKVRLNL